MAGIKLIGCRKFEERRYCEQCSLRGDDCFDFRVENGWKDIIKSPLDKICEW